jgi:UDP-N-acetylglucosamine--N-acetylmuramyl-(pentapeptide) pyrophosphoryl-undecaprenol N-acetylglucosamine transferase
MSQNLVVVAAGGTGGHLFPAWAFAEEMLRRAWRVVLMTDIRGRRYAEGFPAEQIIDVPAATFSLANPIKAASGGLRVARGIAAAQGHLQRLDAGVIAGFGGYPSVPALWAARAQKRPILIFQSDAVLGRVNRFFAKDAAAIACGFERLDKLTPACVHLKRVVGNPVRPAILAARDKHFPDIAAGARLVVLITGGSQGARLFGEVAPAAFAMLPDDLRARVHVVQQTREEQLDVVRAAYARAGVSCEIAPFFTDMAERLAAAHLFIGRAGASSVTEAQVVGRAAILVPLGIAADDHQTANAEALASVGAADVIAQPDFAPETLAPLLTERLSDPHGLSVRGAAARASARTDAAERLADLAIALAQR